MDKLTLFLGFLVIGLWISIAFLSSSWSSANRRLKELEYKLQESKTLNLVQKVCYDLSVEVAEVVRKNSNLRIFPHTDHGITTCGFDVCGRSEILLTVGFTQHQAIVGFGAIPGSKLIGVVESPLLNINKDNIFAYLEAFMSLAAARRS